ncbi:sulfotransferase family [Fragilaria crotonensis]|nr:sulfotransferase family [Fragilaria crotonensis]
MSSKGRRITFIVVVVVVCSFLHLTQDSFRISQMRFIDVQIHVDANIHNSSDVTGIETAVRDRGDIGQNETSPSLIVRWKPPRALGVEPFTTSMTVDRQQQPGEKKPQKHEVGSRLKLNVTSNYTDTYFELRRALAPIRIPDSPIVIPEYKLLFFAIPKVGCTVFKQLFRRIAKCPDWRAHSNGLPHNPLHNNLTYLSHYGDDDQLHMMTSREWTRAVFVRHPMDRIISAYLDKAVHDHAYNGNLSFVAKRCCPLRNACGPIAERSFQDFVHVARACPNPHWNSQSQRMQRKYWRYINFVGHLETAQADTKALLERVGAWVDYGATGWGANGNETIFGSKATVVHNTNPQDQMNVFCSKESVALVEALYPNDLRNPLFDFRGSGICSQLV